MLNNNSDVLTSEAANLRNVASAMHTEMIAIYKSGPKFSGVFDSSNSHLWFVEFVLTSISWCPGSCNTIAVCLICTGVQIFLFNFIGVGYG